MKSDLSQLQALLDSWQVPYAMDDGLTRPHEQALIVSEPSPEWRVPDSDKVEGFPGFFTRFVFTKDGIFLRVGAWE